jgi:hypothetical protein
MPNSALNWRMNRFAELCPTFAGLEAIHVERPGVLHVRVSEVSCDDWGMKAKLTFLHTPGMYGAPGSSFTLAASWDTLSSNALEWDTPNIPACRWTTYFDPAIVQAIVGIAAEAHRKGSVIGFSEAKDWLSAYRRRKDRLSSPSET